MKFMTVAALVILCLPMGAMAKPSPLRAPHLDLEMGGEEYRRLLEANPGLLNFSGGATDADLKPVLDVGKRNLDWLKFINDHRDARHMVSLTSKATQTGIPIDKPKKYNPQLIRQTYDALVARLPAPFKAVVVDGAAFTTDPQMTDKDYADLGRAVDKSYQMAARWFTMEPYIAYLTREKARDIRGYYFLSRDPAVRSKLSHWTQNTAENQKLFSFYLLSMCLNSGARNCASALNKAISADQAFNFYEKYFNGAKAVYESFFAITTSRRDVTWKSGAQEEMHVPFVDPTRDDLRHFLADNIQDEWKWNNWQLLLDFVGAGSGTAHLEFEAGATPHVNGLAGDTITMDENMPLSEFDVQWTIRHEFGHVIGFPDCYVEFYEPSEKAIVNYQLDVTDVMCSRKGTIHQRHYDELKKVYGH